VGKPGTSVLYCKRLENCRIEEGMLIIEARKENWEEKNYTSTRLVSRNKGDWTYGRFEIRAALPSGRGTWPAIWMLATDWTYGNGGWPANGEIDIMEYVGYNPGKVHASIHTQKYYHSIGTQKTAVTNVADAEKAFHVYALEWTPEQIDIFVDSTKYFTFKNEGKGWEYWPFDKNFFLLLNIAVGGNWGGQQGVDDSIFPQRLLIDYVRVYKER
jgi:beta-glucanase (GH16 family)